MAKRQTAPAVPVPQTREAFETAAVQLGELMRKVDRINAKAADRIAQAKLDAKTETVALGRDADALWKAIAGYAEAHRDELLPKDRKSVAIAAGIIGWRVGKAKVQIDDEETVLALLEERGDELFVRAIIEIDKAAMLLDRETAETIQGVEIVQGEELFFKPLDIEDERVKRAPLAKAAA